MCPEDWDNLGLRNPSPDAKPIFQRITEAYSILSDDKKRLKYDKSGRRRDGATRGTRRVRIAEVDSRVLLSVHLIKVKIIHYIH